MEKGFPEEELLLLNLCQDPHCHIFRLVSAIRVPPRSKSVSWFATRVANQLMFCAGYLKLEPFPILLTKLASPSKAPASIKKHAIGPATCLGFSTFPTGSSHFSEADGSTEMFLERQKGS